MGGRLLDYIAQGDSLMRPLASSMPAKIAAGGTSFYYSTDTKVLSVFDSLTGAWKDVDGGGGGGGTQPTVVQIGYSVGPTNPAVTLATAPTKGNLLVAFGTHWSDVVSPDGSSGWTTLLNRSGVSTDGDIIAYKYATEGESATQTPYAAASSASVAIFEIHNGKIRTGMVRAIKETVAAASTLKFPSPLPTALLIGMVASVSNNSTPALTGITGLSAGATQVGVSANASPRGVTAFSKAVAQGDTLNLTATWTGAVNTYISGVIIEAN